jgi:flagellar basal-body rod modification protein FlgD
MIGKEVVTNSGNSLVVNGSTTDIGYNLATDAQSVTISILDKNGKLVQTLDETAQKAGTNKVTWDSSGVENGDYTFQVTAKNSQGQPVSVTPMTSGLVTAVHFKNNQISATVNGKEIPLSNIIEVKQSETPLSDMINVQQKAIPLRNIIEAIKQGKS